MVAFFERPEALSSRLSVSSIKDIIPTESVNGSSKSRIDGVTDWFIPESNVLDGLAYPGPVKIHGDLIAIAEELLATAKAAYEKTNSEANGYSEIRSDYRLTYQGVYMRGHRQQTVDGVIHILRVTNFVKDVSELNMPQDVVDLLCCEEIGRTGGLIIICGRPGHGKSTSCAAFVSERVRRLGGFCLTVEDPPEFPLHGNYSPPRGRIGKIIQVHANGRHFGNDLRDALRCYPSSEQGSMLMLGEVRDADSAAQVLVAAASGQLVFITSHAGSIVSGINRIISLAKREFGDQREATMLLSSSLRAVIYQNLDAGRVSVSPLFSIAPDSEVATIISGGDMRMLATEINRQQSLMKSGTLMKSLLK